MTEPSTKSTEARAGRFPPLEKATRMESRIYLRKSPRSPVWEKLLPLYHREGEGFQSPKIREGGAEGSAGEEVEDAGVVEALGEQVGGGETGRGAVIVGNGHDEGTSGPGGGDTGGAIFEDK